MSDRIDWGILKTEYVTSNLSQRDLAAKHDISIGEIGVRAAEEGWVEAREQYRSERDALAVRKTLEKQAETLSEERKQAIAVINTVIAMGLAQLRGKKTPKRDAEGKVVLDEKGQVVEEWDIRPSMKLTGRELVEAAKLKLVLLGDTVQRTELLGEGATTVRKVIQVRDLVGAHSDGNGS